MRGPSIPVLQVGDTLLVTIQVDLKDTVADQMQDDILAALARTHATGLVVDISGLEMVDSYIARVLAETGKMAVLMGAHTVLAGMRPSVAATLVRMGFRMEGVAMALNVDDALVRVSRLARETLPKAVR